MAENKVNNENYVTIQGWMIRELGLKGNELVIYAIIYGFSQAENQVYNGSLQYLADWTNSSKQSVMNCLKSLTEKKLIIKKENYINGVKFCEYHATKLYGVYNKVVQGMQQSCIGGIQQSCTNKKDTDKESNTLIYKTIIDYLNEKAGKDFKFKSKDSQKHINARLSEGFTVEDFKTVIDKKCADWLGTEWEQYLRPATLFGTKFESYLNAKSPKQKAATDQNVPNILDNIM